MFCHPLAVQPQRATDWAVGFDLSSVDSLTIAPKERELVRTGLKMQTPLGTYGRIAPRRGLASKFQITTDACVIDRDDRGEVNVLMVNHSAKPYTVLPGDRIAQLI